MKAADTKSISDSPAKGVLVGYARVSTAEQNPQLQHDALKAAGCARIFEDHVSGAKEDRLGLDDALNYLRPGDTLVVWRLDRLGRSLKHLIEMVTKLETHGIGFKSLNEAIDTTTSGGKLIFHIFGALAEFERNLIRERTNAGLTAARARGRKGGRPMKLNEKQAQTLRRLYDSREHSVADICKMLSISKTALYGYLDRRKADQSSAAP